MLVHDALCLCGTQRVSEHVCAYGSKRQRKKRGSKERQKEKRSPGAEKERGREEKRRLVDWGGVAVGGGEKPGRGLGAEGTACLRSGPLLGSGSYQQAHSTPSHSHLELVSPSSWSPPHTSPP